MGELLPPGPRHHLPPPPPATQLPVYASGPVIPDVLMMDLRGMKIGEKVMASAVELNEGLRLVRVGMGRRVGAGGLNDEGCGASESGGRQ